MLNLHTSATVRWLSFIPMLKTKQRRFAIVAIMLFSLIAMYGGVPTVSAASLDSAKVTLSDSDLDAIGTVIIDFKPGSALTAGQYVNINFESGFTTIDSDNATCFDDASRGGAGLDVFCTVVTPITDATTSMTISGITNPGTAKDYSIIVSTHDVGGALLKTSEVKVYIIDDVTVTAHVAASLTFSVTGIATTTSINGDDTTGSTSPTEIDFKTLEIDTEQRMAQELAVSTNADGGFSVTVQQDGNMRSAAGADIDSFVTGAHADWALNRPARDINDENTWGQMGIASNGSDLTVPFVAGEYEGLDDTNALEVFSHDGPANGTTQDAGKASIMYNIEITALQEAGDYQNILTYICTPTY